MEIKVQVEGLKQTLDNFAKLEHDAREKIIRGSIYRASKPMLERAKANAPSDTGELRKRTRLFSFPKRELSPGETSYKIQTVFAKNKKKETANQYYAHMIQEGTVDPRESRKGKARYRNVRLFKTNVKVKVSSGSSERGIMKIVTRDGKIIFRSRTKGLKANPYIEKSFVSEVSNVENRFATEFEKSLTNYCRKEFAAK